MNTLLCAALLLIPANAPDFKDRPRHPLAPSLPRLTKEEGEKIEAVIDRFIQYDVGKLAGAEGKKALADFHRLGPEATFHLIEGLNRAGNMESSCPAVIIAKKLASIFFVTEDVELLTFARENIGAGVTAKRHLEVLSDLKFQCQLRKAALLRAQAARGKAVAVLSLVELEKAAAKDRGPRLKAVLTEAEKRQGPQAVAVLVRGIAQADAETAQWSRTLLAKNLRHQSPELLKALLKHERPEVRIAAAQAIGGKKLPCGTELLALLQDGDDDVRQAGRRALVQLSGGIDHGPDPQASFGEREAAVTRWRAWCGGQK